jgi:hypothetical protein
MRHLRPLTITVRVAGACAAALLLWGSVGFALAATEVAQVAPAIEAEVRSRVAAGRARVLVELRVPRVGAAEGVIGRTQDAVLERLPPGHASVTRRYASVPLLALEIDAVALQALEAMGDIVSGVKLDGLVRSQ